MWAWPLPLEATAAAVVDTPPLPRTAMENWRRGEHGDCDAAAAPAAAPERAQVGVAAPSPNPPQNGPVGASTHTRPVIAAVPSPLHPAEHPPSLPATP